MDRCFWYISNVTFYNVKNTGPDIFHLETEVKATNQWEPLGDNGPLLGLTAIVIWPIVSVAAILFAQ